MNDAGFGQKLLAAFASVGLHPYDLLELALTLGSLLGLIFWVVHVWLRRRYQMDYEYMVWSRFLWSGRHLFAFFFGLLLMRGFLFEPIRIEDDGNHPTVRQGEHVLIQKFSFGIRPPLAREPWFYRDKPRRGDLVVYRLKSNPYKTGVVRIIGLPGERVRVDRRSGEVYINGGKFLQSPINSDNRGLEKGVHVVQEDLGGRAIHIKKNTRIKSPLGSWLPDEGRMIPDHGYFGLFDNRDACCDSRDNGVIEIRQIIGKAYMVFMSDRNGISFANSRFIP